jgi:hypothetical protein
MWSLVNTYVAEMANVASRTPICCEPKISIMLIEFLRSQGQRIELNIMRSVKWIVCEYGKEISRKVDGGEWWVEDGLVA